MSPSVNRWKQGKTCINRITIYFFKSVQLNLQVFLQVVTPKMNICKHEQTSNKFISKQMIDLVARTASLSIVEKLNHFRITKKHNFNGQTLMAS